MDFNLQQYLEAARAEQNEQHNRLEEKIDRLEGKVDRFAAVQASHNTRLVVLEGTRRNLHWLGGTVIVSAVGAFFTWLAGGGK